MKKILRQLYPLYPLILFAALIAVGFQEKSHAGVIRTLILKPNQPGKVFLSYGESTAISFPARPEKLSPGSPNKIHIEFVKNTDITVTPLMPSQKLGNLIVYTRSGRYVILFEGAQGSYDDAVNLSFAQPGPPLHITEDTYFAEKVDLSLKPHLPSHKEDHIQVTALILSNEKTIFGTELISVFKDVKSLRCHDCSITNKKSDTKIICSDVIKSITCENAQYSKITIVRGKK
jgi:hypothetical protein